MKNQRLMLVALAFAAAVMTVMAVREKWTRVQYFTQAATTINPTTDGTTYWYESATLQEFGAYKFQYNQVSADATTDTTTVIVQGTMFDPVSGPWSPIDTVKLTTNETEVDSWPSSAFKDFRHFRWIFTTNDTVTVKMAGIYNASNIR